MIDSKKISILIMITACILCISSAGTVNANIAPSDNNSTIILPANDDAFNWWSTVSFCQSNNSKC